MNEPTSKHSTKQARSVEHAGRRLRNERIELHLQKLDLALTKSLSRKLKELANTLSLRPELRQSIASMKSGDEIEALGVFVVEEIERNRILPRKVISQYRRAIKERVEFRKRLNLHLL